MSSASSSSDRESSEDLTITAIVSPGQNPSKTLKSMSMSSISSAITIDDSESDDMDLRRVPQNSKQRPADRCKRISNGVGRGRGGRPWEEEENEMMLRRLIATGERYLDWRQLQSDLNAGRSVKRSVESLKKHWLQTMRKRILPQEQGVNRMSSPGRSYNRNKQKDKTTASGGSSSKRRRSSPARDVEHGTASDRDVL
jgi:hypothetical protein